MIPTVDETQHAINQLIDLVLEVSKGITCWQKEYSHDGTKNKGESLSADTWIKKTQKQVDRNDTRLKI